MSEIRPEPQWQDPCANSSLLAVNDNPGAQKTLAQQSEIP